MSNNTDRVCILIPFFNNPATVNEVAHRCYAYMRDIFLINDGSTDGSETTIELLPGMRLLHQSVNRGKGVAVRTGAYAALADGFTHCIQIDADLQHNPDNIPSFINSHFRSPTAIIIGTRQMDRSMPLLSRFGRWFGNLWVRIETLGVRVDDTQCGYRLYPLSVFNTIHFDQDRMAFDVEVIVKSVRCGYPIINLEIPVTYFTGSDRITHFHLIRDNWEMSKLHFQFTWGCLIHWPCMLNSRFVSSYRSRDGFQRIPIDSSTPQA